MWFSNNNNNNNNNATNSNNNQSISSEGKSSSSSMLPTKNINSATSTTTTSSSSSSSSSAATNSSQINTSCRSTSEIKPTNNNNNTNSPVLTTNQKNAPPHSVHKEDRPEKISFHLKTSIFTRRITIDIDKMALGLIKQLAIAFLNELYFQHQYPTNTSIGDYIKKNFSHIDNLNSLYDRLILRKYDCEQETFLPFYSVSDIEPESYISIEVGEKKHDPTIVAATTATTTTHLLNTLSMNALDPNNSESDSGLTTAITASTKPQKQQYSQQQPSSPSSPHTTSSQSSTTAFTNSLTNSATGINQSTFSLTNSSLAIVSSSSSSSSSAVIAAATNQRIKIAHEFKQESFLLPTYCASCSTLIKGVFRQGFQCSFCKKNFCPKCKNKAEAAGDSCLIPTTSQSIVNSFTTTTASSSSSSSAATLPSSQRQNTTSDSSSGVSSVSSASTLVVGGDTNNSPFNMPGPNSNSNTASKLDILHLNMSKRKSASNLLHFNIANPFKSHHSIQQQTPGSPREEKHHNQHHHHKTMRGSAGALDPVLQQLGKMRDQQHKQQQLEQVANKLNKLATVETNESNLLVAQNAHLSSSHQNLYLNNDIIDPKLKTSHDDNAIISGISDQLKTSCQLDGNSKESAAMNQANINSSASSSNKLSSSARSSAHDLHVNSPIKRDSANHTFISMDWIQINGEPLCDVCSKLLKGQNVPPVICKSCKLLAHANCQNWVLTDCMTRIVESSRAAAGQQNSRLLTNNDEQKQKQQQQQQIGCGDENSEKTGVICSNSNVSRDNIRLHRLAPSVKNIKRPDATKPIIEGWLKHTTLSDELARKHYWRLDETDITLYENDTSKRYFKAIPVSTIIRVVSSNSLPKRVREDVLISATEQQQQQKQNDGQQQQQQQTTMTDTMNIVQPKSANSSPSKSPQLKEQMNAIFAFEQATGSMYLVQANSEVEASNWRKSLAEITAKNLEARRNSQKEQQTVVEEAKQEIPSEGKQMSSTVGEPNDAVQSTKQDESGKSDEEQNKTMPAETKHHYHHHHHRHHQQQQQQQQPQQQQQKQQQQPLQQQEQQQQQLQPQPQPKQPSVQQQRQHHHHYSNFGHRHHRQQPKTFTDPNRSRLYNRPRITIKLDPMSIPDHIIEGKYLIERDRVKGVGFEELGSGQFGKVYAAISEWKAEDASKGLWSGVPVAIKEISKARFDLRQQAKLKNEANILSRLDHQGVIILERVHDLPDKIYIVMEQLEDDMLEMIVSTEEKRLNERITKFLTYQILEALKYLHAQNIAHCDLKPENVLLVERRSQFPQIKLCDFGFAKIIEENSFRSSLVGTPAYLAPEVVKGERYNRSVDLWSVGVIVYVSLSGEFPFNEGENIHDQISRATFMWPDQPWAKISRQAREFIESLLLVNCEKRLSANRAQLNVWLQVST